MAADPKPAPAPVPANDPTPAAQLTPATPPAPTPPAAPAAVPKADDPAAAFKLKLEQFVADFGPENGSKWAAEGKSREEALKLHADALAAKAKADGDVKDAKIADLEAKLAAIPRGEANPVSFNDAGKPNPGGKAGDVHDLSAKLGDNLAKVANAIKLPGAKA